MKIFQSGINTAMFMQILDTQISQEGTSVFRNLPSVSIHTHTSKSKQEAIYKAHFLLNEYV
jgi:hypothetical protein